MEAGTAPPLGILRRRSSMPEERTLRSHVDGLCRTGCIDKQRVWLTLTRACPVLYDIVPPEVGECKAGEVTQSLENWELFGLLEQGYTAM